MKARRQTTTRWPSAHSGWFPPISRKWVPVSEARSRADFCDDQLALANTNFGEVLVEGYGLLNARLSLSELEMLGGSWQFALWAKNVQDRDSVSYAIGATSFTFLMPRTYGAELVLEF